MRGVAWVAMGLMLGGCALRDPYVTTAGETKVGKWRIAHQIDRITGSELQTAGVIADGSTTLVDDTKPALLELSCFDNKPIARFSFGFKIGSDKNSFLGYRFDNKPGRDGIESRILLGYQVFVIEDKASVTQFLADLEGSSKLYVRVRSLTAGRTSAEFPVADSAAAVKAAYTDCPMQVPGAAKS